MLITEEVLNGISKDAAGIEDQRSKIDHWFVENEPVFYRWMVDRANGMVNINVDGFNIMIQPSIQRMLVERMITCLQMGYIVATVAGNASHLEEIGVHSFLSTVGGSADEIYSMWLAGRLREQYYTEEIGAMAPPEDYKEAVENFQQLKLERERHEKKIVMVKKISGSGEEPDSEGGTEPSEIELGGMEI